MNIRSLNGLTVEIESEKTFLVMEGSKDHETAAVITNSQGEEFETSAHILTWPGEYEIQGWLMKGIEANGAVVFSANIEGMHVVHTGAVKNIDSKIIDELEDIDVLILPVETDIRSADEAKKLVANIEARMVIPVGSLAGNFIELSGTQDIQPTPKAKITKSGLPLDKTEFIQLISE